MPFNLDILTEHDSMATIKEHHHHHHPSPFLIGNSEKSIDAGEYKVDMDVTLEIIEPRAEPSQLRTEIDAARDDASAISVPSQAADVSSVADDDEATSTSSESNRFDDHRLSGTAAAAVSLQSSLSHYELLEMEHEMLKTMYKTMNDEHK
mmetsp:Transcript_43636/g.52876  ORF Transcript_43636/g.52876 Transcript_43636/m.52876 type:complete len:150 (+) Transcript_43636:169-618(+)